MRFAVLAVVLVGCAPTNGIIAEDAEVDATAPVEEDATPAADVQVEAAAPARCVSSIRLPTETAWGIVVNYTDGLHEDALAYDCPSAATATTCASSLRSAQRPDGSGKYVYPRNDACSVAVPAACLPCTGAVTVW